jgi:hypothetical protein
MPERPGWNNRPSPRTGGRVTISSIIDTHSFVAYLAYIYTQYAIASIAIARRSAAHHPRQISTHRGSARRSLGSGCETRCTERTGTRPLPDERADQHGLAGGVAGWPAALADAVCSRHASGRPVRKLGRARSAPSTRRLRDCAGAARFSHVRRAGGILRRRSPAFAGAGSRGIASHLSFVT